MPNERPRRLGRPPATSSADTRRRILDVARQTFAELGWEVTTNKVVADKANVTSGALYHYFDSKVEMYRAVHDDVQRIVSAEFAEAVAASDTFVGQFEAILERALEVNSRDPSLARFLASSRVDMNRQPELRGAIRRPPAERSTTADEASGRLPRRTSARLMLLSVLPAELQRPRYPSLRRSSASV